MILLLWVIWFFLLMLIVLSDSEYLETQRTIGATGHLECIVVKSYGTAGDVVDGTIVIALLLPHRITLSFYGETEPACRLRRSSPAEAGYLSDIHRDKSIFRTR
jgi:hypothetical protein